MRMSRNQVLTSIVFVLISLVVFSGKMNSEPNIEALVKKQALAWEQGNASSIVEDFAPSATFIAAGHLFQGVDAIAQAAEDYFRQFTDTKVTIKRIIIGGNQGAVEWDWSDRHRQTGKQSAAEDAIIFELQDNGKISYWREYIEKKQ